MTAVEKDIEKYIDEVKTYLVCLGKKKQKVASEIKNSIFVYAEENGITDIKEVYDRFGTPEEIARQHLADIDPKMVKKKLLVYEVAAVLSALVAVLIAMMLIYQMFDSSEYVNGFYDETPQIVYNTTDR